MKKLQGRSQIKIWCCASSTGEEPYSIAMTVVEAFNSFNTPVSVFASDLDTNVLATAAKGIYARERVDRLSPERLNRFFVKGSGSLDGFYSVRPELRRMVSFLPQRHDLFRQADPTQNTAPICAPDAGRRSAFRRALRKFLACGGSVPLAGENSL